MSAARHDTKTMVRWRPFYQPMPARWAAIESGTFVLREDPRGIFLAAQIVESSSSPTLPSHLLWSSAPSRASLPVLFAMIKERELRKGTLKRSAVGVMEGTGESQA